MDSYNVNGANFYVPGSDYSHFNSTDSDNSTNRNIDWNEIFFGERHRSRSASNFSTLSVAEISRAPRPGMFTKKPFLPINVFIS